MTQPLPLPSAPAAPPATAHSPVAFPLTWLLDHACGPIQYRAVAEVARAPSDVAYNFAALAYGHEAALWLAMTQSIDGGWNQSMFSLPTAKQTHGAGVGTMHAVRRLLEFGWDKESPPLVQARRLLFRLLAEDNDPKYLFELAPTKGATVESNRRSRLILREASAALLAQAGYEQDPRLRGAARRLVERAGNYLKSPLAAKPWVRVGNKQVLHADATPPSTWLLWMLSFMPHFRAEHHEHVELIYHHLTQPMPRQEPVQMIGDKLLLQPHLVLGDELPHRNAVEADIPKALQWLELMARMGFLKRNENWLKMFDRFLDDRDSQGVWHPHKGSSAPRTTNPFAWGMFPLEPPGAGDERWVDVTFRIGLIARLAGRPIALT